MANNTKNNLFVEDTTGKTFKLNNDVFEEVVLPSTGVAGPQGIQGIQGVKGDTGPIGPMGPPGPSGGGSGTTLVTPHLANNFNNIVVVGTNTTDTLANRGISPSVYAGITVTTNDLYDWCNLQYAMYLEQQNNKPIDLVGTFRTNKMIDMGKYNKRLVINGNFAHIRTVGTTAFSVLGRPQPTDNGDANQMIASTFDIHNLEITCANTQIGLEPGPTYGSRYTGILVNNALTAVHLRFNLMAIVEGCFATGCTKGFLFDTGNWTGATTTNSQSNGSIARYCRCYFSTVGDVGFGVYGTGGVWIASCIVEGLKCKRGVEIDGKANTTTKRNYVDNFHWETVQGTLPAGQGEAAVYVRLGGGVVEISNMKNDYASVMIDAASQGGWLTIDLRNVSFWKNIDGKAFQNTSTTTGTGGTSWKIRNYEKTAAAILAEFAGVPVTQACQSDNDSNKVCIQ